MVSGDADGAAAVARKAIDATISLRRFAPELPIALEFVLALDTEDGRDAAHRELLIYDKAARRRGLEPWSGDRRALWRDARRASRGLGRGGAADGRR